MLRDFVLKWSDVEWTDVIYVKGFYFEVKWREVKWSEVSYIEVLGDKSTMHIRVTLYWGYLIVLWLFYLVCILYCGGFDLFCNVCVCVGFVMCGCVYVWVL